MESPGKKFTDLVEIESIQDTDLAVIRNDTGVKKTPMQKLSDYIKQKFIGWVFSDLPTTDKTIPGALKELNSALLYEKFAYDTTGENFNKNLLLIDTNNTEAIVNQRSFFEITDSTRGDYVNIPSAMPSEGVVIGYRAVYVKSAIHCLVKITECFPVSGRQYFNFYNSGNWDGWKVIQP